MNERIKELVVESGNGLMRDGKLYPHIGSRTKEDWERFAELIVREMLVLTYDEETRYYNMNEDHLAMAMENYRELAKEHFGVEE